MKSKIRFTQRLLVLSSIDRDMMDKARAEGLQIFSEFATLNGKTGFRKYRFDQLRDLITTYDLDGVWMDYVHWHAQFEEPEPILPETCFCEHCLGSFSQSSGVEIPEGSIPEKAEWILETQDKVWREWRSQVIYDWSLEMRKILKEHNPDALLGLFHCPWDDEEFETVLRGGLSGKSSGVMMFTTYAVAEDDGKTAVMLKVYMGE